MAAQRLAALITGLALLFGASLAHASGGDEARNLEPLPWASLPAEEQQVLAPLQSEWHRLPGYQQRRLRAAARQYPRMQPEQQQRFQARVREWATMAPQQRKEARERFQGMQKLSEEQKREMRERWLERRAQEKAGPGNARGDTAPGKAP